MRVALRLLATCLGVVTPLCGGTPVRVHVDWFPGAQYAGLYLAEDRGLFRDAGLDVEIVPFAFGQDAPAGIAADPAVAALGFAEGYVFLQYRARGADVCAFTAVLRESPAGLISVATRPVLSARDFRGRILGVHTFADGMFRWFGAEAGLDVADFTLRTVGNELDQLASGEIDALQGYAIEEFVLAQRRFGEDEVRFVSFAEMGFTSSAQVVYSTREKSARHRATIERWIDALRGGWIDALAQPADAVAAVVRRMGPGAVVEEQRAMLRALAEYVRPGNTAPLAPLDAEAWRRAQKTLVAMGLIARVEEPATFLVDEDPP